MKEEFDYRRLMVRFFDRTANGDELQKLMQWLEESDEHKRIFNEFNESHQYADISVKGWIYDTDANWKQLKSRIKPEQIKIVTRRQFNWLNAAAVIAILITVGTLAHLFFNQSESDYSNQVVNVIAPPGQRSQIILQDGTTVWLNSGSELAYVYKAKEKRRVVTLEGEAFFDVAKDKDKPFIVETDGVDLVVYGTRFNVHSYADENTIETTLEEGSVGVKVHSNGKEWLMKPGQQCVFNKVSQSIELEEANIQFFTAWTDNKLIFDDNTFKEVVRKLERWYGVTIELDEKLSTTQRFTMTLSDESLKEALDLIKITTPLKYSINGKQVTIACEK